MMKPLYDRLLGDAAERLPPVIRRMHATAPRVDAIGTGTVSRGGNPVSRAIGWLLGLPAAGENRPLRVTFAAGPAGETLSRHYPDAVLTTVQRDGGPAGSGLVIEELGPFALSLQLQASAHGLDFHLVGLRWHGLTLPRAAWPRLAAEERAEGERYRFHVRIDLPLLGRLIEYQGSLEIAEAATLDRQARERAATDGPLVLYDGVCGLCNGTVRFVLARDRTQRLFFAPIQSEIGQAVLRRHDLPLDDWESFVFLDHGRARLKSAAFLQLVRVMRRPWPLLAAARFVPTPLADWLYDRVARNRYRLFRRHEHCLVPPAEIRCRFLQSNAQN